MRYSKGDSHRFGHAVVGGVLAVLCTAVPILPQTTAKRNSFEVLGQFSEAVQALSARVAPSVVQISVTRFAPHQDEIGSRTDVALSKQQAVGSGVIIDSEGYIVTNAHVVADAQRIRVRLTAPPSRDAAQPDGIITSALGQTFSLFQDATLIGVFKEADLALIKIAASGLPTLPFANYQKLRQGQVVFAFGSREGLANSVSMGVISSVARQPDQDSPFIYVQTDAPINPGDSGGPLINTAGEIVGLDTFILSQSGGSEGLGFAIPSPLVELVGTQLRKYGHMHRSVIGIGVQTITPVLSRALNLPRSSGILVSDVLPGSPAESAGVQLNDIIIEIDGKQAINLPLFMTSMLVHGRGDVLKLRVLRQNGPVELNVTAAEESHGADRLTDLIDGDKSLIRKLGILGVNLDEHTAILFPNLRGDYGVVVAARSADAAGVSIGLQSGDVIHELNGAVVTSVEALRKALAEMTKDAAAALFIEREGKLLYVVFEIE
jgi:serine protease Do